MADKHIEGVMSRDGERDGIERQAGRERKTLRETHMLIKKPGENEEVREKRERHRMIGSQIDKE